MASEIALDQDYTYESSGIDEFFMRPQELIGSPNLFDNPVGGAGNISELNLDSVQVGGSLGSVYRIGERFLLDGITGTLDIQDAEGRVVVRLSSEEA